MLDLKLTRKTEHPIQQRRDYDNAQLGLQSKLRNEFLEAQHAKWENKGSKVSVQKRIKDKLNELKLEARRNLNERKGQLSLLLSIEHNQYKKEIENMQETSEQIVEKMKVRVDELKKKREESRIHYVNIQLEKKFMENCDEIRQIKVQQKLCRIVQERDQQMIEKQEQMMRNYEEEMVYNELYKRDLLQKNKAELQKIKDQQKKRQERTQILDIQKQQTQNQKEYEKQFKIKEQRMMKQEYDYDLMQNQNALQERKTMLMSQNQDMILFNEEQKQIKERQIQMEKEEDKRMIQEIVDREQKIVELEAQLKEREKEEQIEYLKQNEQKQGTAKEYEKYVQKLVDEQNEKQWQKQMQKWQKDEDMKVKLMYEVYDQREQNIKYKQSIREQELIEKQKDKELVAQNLQKFQQEEQEKKRNEIISNKNYQTEILNQIENKNNLKQTNLLSQMQQEKQERILQLEQERKIQQIAEYGKQTLQSIKSNRPF